LTTTSHTLNQIAFTASY